MSTRKHLPSAKKEGNESSSWDVESIFNPPKYHFSQTSADREPITKLSSPPRFALGKKRKSSTNDDYLKNASREDSPTSKFKSEEGNDAKREDQVLHHHHERQYEEELHRERQYDDTAMEDQDAFPIKFSLSNDYKSDASFTEYLKESLMEPSPRGSPGLGLGPTLGSFGAMFAPSPLQERDTVTFDFGPNAGGGGFPMPKLQMSPMSTPPRGGGANKLDRGGGDHGDEDCLANAKLESPPTLKKPFGRDGNNQMPPPRFPMELINRSDGRDPMMSLSPRNPTQEDGSPYRPITNNERSPYNRTAGRTTNHHHHQIAGGPAQHYSPGRTIYNVASKSVGSPSPSSPFNPYPWRPAPHAGHATPQSMAGQGRSSHTTPQSRYQQGGAPPSMETTPEFNPPRGNLRGQSRSVRETTITVSTAHDTNVNGSEPNTTEDSKAVQFYPPGSNATKLDPITPSPLRQAVSDESPSPVVAPTVHHPAPPRSTACPTSGGGGWDSLHMAPLPPYVQSPHHAAPAAWGNVGGRHPPALPLPSGSGYPQHANHYYSPYYNHQHQHQQQQQHQQQHRQQHPRHQHPHQHPRQAVPDHATSNNEAGTAQNSNEAAEWRKYHHLLHQFLLQFGHCNVPQGYGVGTHYEGLHRWCNEQRTQYQRMCRANNGNHNDSDIEASTMTPTRVRVLTGLGFVWGHPPSGFRPARSGSPHNPTTTKPYSTWDKWMELLSDYRSQHGNIDVPLKYEPNFPLGTFVNRQRTEYRKMQTNKPSSMTPERVDELNRLGFTWAVRESHTSWEDRFGELKEFRDENGHCNVPKIYNKNPSLGYWVNEQRFQYRRMLKKKPSYMTQEKITMLNGLEFKWSLRETNGSWENWLKELRDYKNQHGDVDVPLKYRHNQALGAFVNRQRTEYRKLQQGLQTSLTEQRIQSLNDLGFKWAIRVSRTPWETRLEELKKFKEQHSHCNVPSTYPKNQPLAYWVFKQRGQFRIYSKRDYVIPGEQKQTCHMTPDRISKLDDIGFEWNPPRRIK